MHAHTYKVKTKCQNLSGRTSACCFGTMLDLVSELSTAREERKMNDTNMILE